MLLRSFELQWTLSWFFLVIANYFGAFRDTYFWDQAAYNFVKKRFKDWHNVKILELASLILAARLIPIPLGTWTCWIPAFCWLAIRWMSWEFWMNEATMSFVYEGNKKWLGGILYVNHRVALLLAVVFILVPYFI